jgi:hypothetical protein
MARALPLSETAIHVPKSTSGEEGAAMDNPNRKTSGSREESMKKDSGVRNPSNVGKGGGSRGDATGDEDTRRGSQTRPGKQNVGGPLGRETNPSQGVATPAARAPTAGTGKGTFGSENLTEDDLSTTPRTAGASPRTLGSESTAKPSDLTNRGGGLNADVGDTRTANRGQVGLKGNVPPTGKDSGAMRGSTSGTTGFGGEKNRGKSGSPGGVEGVGSESDSVPDEDRR